MNKSVRVAIPLGLILLMFLVFIACTSGPTTSNQTPTNASNRAETATLSSGKEPSCNPAANAANRAAAMNLHFSDANNANTGDAEIDMQRGVGFNVDFEAVDDKVVMKVTGRFASKEQSGGPPKPKFQKLIDRLEWYLKKGCADSASFSVENNLCTDDQVLCPNGTCAPPGECPRIPKATPTPAPAPTRDANPTANNSTTNSNGNSNSNSGPNRNSNSRSGP